VPDLESKEDAEHSNRFGPRDFFYPKSIWYTLTQTWILRTHFQQTGNLPVAKCIRLGTIMLLSAELVLLNTSWWNC